MKHFFLLTIFLSFSQVIFAQNADSLRVAREVDSLIKVSRSLTGNRAFDKAIDISSAAENLALKHFGRESSVYGGCCANRGRIFAIKNDYVEAEKWWLEARSVYEMVFGKVHTQYASMLNNLAKLYYITYQYNKAELFFIEARSIREKIGTKNNLELAMTLNDFALLYWKTGKLIEAESICFEAQKVIMTIGNENHPLYNTNLSNLANIYSSMCLFEKAERIYLESKILQERNSGKNTQNYANTMNSLGSLYLTVSNFEKAESIYLEAKSIIEKDKRDPTYAALLNNLGILYSNILDYKKAELYYLECKSIREKELGTEHLLYAQILNNLGVLYLKMSHREKAESFHVEAKTIREKIQGKEHTDYAESLNNLAIVYFSGSDPAKAEPLLLESLAIKEKKLSKNHFEYAGALFNLAKLYDKLRDYNKAASLYLESKRIRENILGKGNLEYVEIINNLAKLYCATGNNTNAEPYFLETSSIQKSLLLKTTRHLSERELSSYTQKFTAGLSQIYSFAHTKSGISPTCYDNTLFYKGFLQNAAARVNRPILPDSATTEQYYLFKSLHRRLAAEYAKPIAERKNVDTLENRANELEKELTRKIAGYGEALRQVNWQEVQGALKPNEAAIEFVHYNYWNKRETDSVMYAALVLRPGMAQPLFVPLFEEKQLTALLDPKGKTPDVFYKSRYTYEDGGKSLYQVVWGPLEAHLQGAKKVFCSPSGLLHRLSLADLPAGSKANVGDNYEISIIGSTRQLVVNQSGENSTKTALFFGGIQYDMDSTAYFNASDTRSGNGMRGAPAGFYADSTLRGGSWKYLPGTEKEAIELSQTAKSKGFESQVLLGFTASEERFKALDGQSPQILHLATHGFFFPDAQNKSGTGLDNEPVFKYNDNPLLRAGLILAGGNHAWTKGHPLKPNMEDGILTAYEIAHLDLSKTELVVLSACETGLGDIRGNEGVYGLQRAFKIAGAKNILMSLWQVPDQQTARFMGIFYKKWLNDNMSIADALQTTKKQLKDRGYDPFYWAGFVLVE